MFQTNLAGLCRLNFYIMKSDNSSPQVSFEGMVQKFSYKGGMHYLEVPAETAAIFTNKSSVRVICTVLENSFQCALMPLGEGTFFITLSKKLMGNLGVKLGDRISAQIQADESPYGLPMPEELGEVLAQDEEADQAFHELTPGKQRSIIVMVSSLKNVDKRIERALAILEKVKDGVQDLKILSQAKRL